MGFKIKIVKIILENYPLLTNFLKIVLHNCFQVVISFIFIDNQIYSSQLLDILVVEYSLL